VITGIKTTIPFQLAMMDDPQFREGNISTRYVPELMERLKRSM
jgi:acetyl-CoA carboxylase, biotin carboxylase subunit